MSHPQHLNIARLGHLGRAIAQYQGRLHHVHSVVQLVHQFPVVGTALTVAGIFLLVAGGIAAVRSMVHLKVVSAVVQLAVGVVMAVLVMSPPLLQGACNVASHLIQAA